jgi:hypothetical protein
MIEKKTWKEFQDAGLLWWINTILHMFGWAIVVGFNQGEIVEVFPARVKFRGFDEATNSTGYEKVTEYLQKEVDVLLKEVKE